MARKKTAVAEPPEGLTEAPPLALPVEDGASATEAPTSPPGEPHGSPETNGRAHGRTENGGDDRRKPVVSWRLMSDRTTSIELACWANTYRTQSGEEYERLSFTVSRSYRDQTGMWMKGGSWRVHDLPVLTFLIEKAHAYALDRRTTVSADCPF